ncbi:MAG: hypothetical protein ABI222_10485, partial [Opitutaceae bacterium]
MISLVGIGDEAKKLDPFGYTEVLHQSFERIEQRLFRGIGRVASTARCSLASGNRAAATGKA